VLAPYIPYVEYKDGEHGLYTLYFLSVKWYVCHYCDIFEGRENKSCVRSANRAVHFVLPYGQAGWYWNGSCAINYDNSS
jgi:hypothetical protein